MPCTRQPLQESEHGSIELGKKQGQEIQCSAWSARKITEEYTSAIPRHYNFQNCKKGKMYPRALRIIQYT